MHWIGSGFIPILLYATGGGIIAENHAILTEDNHEILTEAGSDLLIEQ
jgi:hypothetical protein